MSELLKSAISEIDYALVSNKGGKEVREHYLNNAKRYINEAEKEQQIQLNEDQQIVLNGLKEFYAVNHSSIATLYELHKKNMQTDSKTVEIWKAYRELNAFEGFQVMQAFAEWGLSND